MGRVVHVGCLVALCLLLTPAEAGHELPIYPSYYPQEIRVEVVGAAEAAKRLVNAQIHAYAGTEPAWGGPVPGIVRSVESLGSYLVLTFHPAVVKARDREARCAAVAALAGAVARRPGRAIFHPYPVTPYHEDYLSHLDLVEATKRRVLSASTGRRGGTARGFIVRAEGELARSIFGGAADVAARGWDATVAEVSTADVLASRAVALDAWLGPPWMKAGWFHALSLLGGAVSDPGQRETVEAMAGRLRRGEHESPEERLNLERDLVTLLASGCERVVLGYTVRREYFNAEFSAGIENVAYDSQTGLNSLMFIRTAKLKDFPWNGWLRIGIGTPPSAAWNPMGGFTDPAGRLIWDAVGDPALLPAPYGGGWVLNRIGDVKPGSRR